MDVKFTSNTEDAIRNASQDAAADMDEGGDDKMMVAEMVLNGMLDFPPYKEAAAEVKSLCKLHGYEAVLRAASEIVRTR